MSCEAHWGTRPLLRVGGCAVSSSKKIARQRRSRLPSPQAHDVRALPFQPRILALSFAAVKSLTSRAVGLMATPWALTISSSTHVAVTEMA